MRFSFPRCPHLPKRVVHPLTNFSSPSETRSGTAVPVRTASCASLSGSSHEVLRPYSALRKLSRHIVQVPPRAPSPFGLSQTLEGLILNSPRGLIACRSHSWGSTLRSLSLPQDPTWLVTRRYPLGVSPPVRRLETAPPGLFVSRKSVLRIEVLHSPPSRCSLELLSLHGIATLRWPRLPTAHPLLTFPSRAFKLTREPGLQRFPAQSSRHLPLSWTPTVLAFPAFRSVRQVVRPGFGPGQRYRFQ